MQAVSICAFYIFLLSVYKMVVRCTCALFCDMKVKYNYLLLNGFADPVETTEKPIQECCACGTAKYRITFYGNWSEKVHPKDYPSKKKPFVTYYITIKHY